MSDETRSAINPGEPEGLDTTLARMARDRAREQQSVVSAAVAGLIAAVAGGGSWAVVTVVTGYQIGWMAVGVGFLVGYGVRLAGKGMDVTFGIVGAVCALLGCLLGNILTACYFIGEQEGIPLMDILPQLDLAIVASLLIETFTPMDLLFYGIAVYEGFNLSTIELTDEDLQGTAAGPVAG